MTTPANRALRRPIHTAELLAVAEELYGQAAASQPMDAMECLDIELAKEELEE